jgi:hypoxanthine phosphoribosyltransferase
LGRFKQNKDKEHFTDQMEEFNENPQLDDLEKILLTEEQIAERICELGKEINNHYQGREIALIAVINGAIPFTADLMRKIHSPVYFDCIRVSSYKVSTESNGSPELIDPLRISLKGKHVLLIDDILDTGLTLNFILEEIRKEKPASLKTCVLLDKNARRKIPLSADFVGFKIPDEFVVGYGLDFAEKYRTLPCVGTLNPDLLNPPSWT